MLSADPCLRDRDVPPGRDAAANRHDAFGQGDRRPSAAVGAPHPQHLADTRLTIRGDGHYGRPEVMAWCEANSVDYILGLPGNAVLDRLVETQADDVRVRRAEAQAPMVRRYTETRYGARSWRGQRRVAARIAATTK